MFLIAAFAAVDACRGLRPDEHDEAQRRTVHALEAVKAATAEEIIGALRFDKG
jgi:hypothetical protein